MIRQLLCFRRPLCLRRGGALSFLGLPVVDSARAQGVEADPGFRGSETIPLLAPPFGKRPATTCLHSCLRRLHVFQALRQPLPTRFFFCGRGRLAAGPAGAQKESQSLCRSPYVDTCLNLFWSSFEHLSVRKCFWVRESSGSGSGDGPEGKFQDRVSFFWLPHSRIPLPWGNQKMERTIGERQPGFSWSLTQICGFSFPRFHQVRYFVGPTRKLVDGKWGTFEVPRLEFAAVEGLR